MSLHPARKMFNQTRNGSCLLKYWTFARKAHGLPSTRAPNFKVKTPRRMRKAPPRNKSYPRPPLSVLQNRWNLRFFQMDVPKASPDSTVFFRSNVKLGNNGSANSLLPGFSPMGTSNTGEAWKSTEVEQAPSPIARLQWEKEATYVRDEPCAPVPCPPREITALQLMLSPETCAVILTRAILKQKSSPKDTTPGDFKLHGLRTTGTANGTNETISYISLQTGLIVRVTEDAKQFMDVVDRQSRRLQPGPLQRRREQPHFESCWSPTPLQTAAKALKLRRLKSFPRTRIMEVSAAS